jgi:hypothetical protein
MPSAAASWPRRDVADHHEERCASCGVELGPGEVVRWASGVGLHPICAGPPVRPPATEVEQLWDDCLPIETSPAALHYLRQRGLHMAALRLDMVRVLRSGYPCPPWAYYGFRGWAETGHRLIVPVYDHAGRMRLVRGWRWQEDDSPKRLAAAGCSVKGLVMAAGRGLELLRGELPEWYVSPKVLIAEGEPDALAATVCCPDWCVLGIAPGCWCQELAGRIPAGSRASIQTDDDEPGDKYAQQIAETLKGRCEITRAHARR